jgi:hypothetical protein
MSKSKLKEFIKKLVKEYTGTGASGGNAGDGNSITSPRPFADDMEEMENYVFKSIYGGDGGHYRKDSDPFNYNRTKMGMFEDEDILKKFIKKEIRKHYGVHDTYGASPRQRRNLSGLIGIQEQLSSTQAKFYADRRIANQKDAIDIERDQTQDMFDGSKAAQVQQQIQFGKQMDDIQSRIDKFKTDIPKQKTLISQIENQIEDVKDDMDLPELQRNKFVQDAGKKLKNEKKKLDDLRKQRQQALTQKKQADAQSIQMNKGFADQSKQFKKTLSDYAKQIRNIGKTKPGTMKEYFKDTNVNLMERMDSYRKEAKRSILMEEVMEKFFHMFEEGKTDEEIVKGYMQKGVQVPEAFVSNARKQWEGYKKSKLDLEMAENEFKNVAKKIVNNPEEEETIISMEDKQLASGLFNEDKKKKTNSKISIDTDEV